MRQLASVVAFTVTLILSLAPGAIAQPEPDFPTLVDIRAAHHPGFDRIVFEFEGGLPEQAEAGWTDRVSQDPSGRPVPVQGNAFIAVVMSFVTAHQAQPPFGTTYSPRNRAFALPNVAHVVAAGDFEALVSFGIGLMKETTILRTARLRGPARFVVDVATSFEREGVSASFVDREAVEADAPPFLQAVRRTVPSARQEASALLRLWAGPTAEEKAGGLRFRASGTTGFRDLRVNDGGVARLTLKGRCDGNGQAVTVADQVTTTLRQFANIERVKTYDRNGQTQHPWGRRNSVPACLAP